MTKYEMVVRPETPRLVVNFKAEADKYHFQWGVMSDIPLMPLIGAIVRVQGELPRHDVLSGGTPHHCPESMLVIAYDAEHRLFDWFIGSEVAVDPMLGMLEAIKSVLAMTMAAKQASNQKVQLYGSDGQPQRR